MSACSAADKTSYTYDAAGNLTSSGTNGVTTTNSYNAAEELTSSVTGSTTSYGYDADGNQTSAGSTSYTYNAADELTGADTSAKKYTYSYDSVGNLATTSLNGAEQSATEWDPNNPLPELAEQTYSSGSVTSEYAWNPDGTLNTETQGGAAGTGTSYYATTDWEGSVTGLVNTGGAQVSSTTYTPYELLSGKVAVGHPGQDCWQGDQSHLCGAGEQPMVRKNADGVPERTGFPEFNFTHIAGNRAVNWRGVQLEGIDSGLDDGVIVIHPSAYHLNPDVLRRSSPGATSARICSR